MKSLTICMTTSRKEPEIGWAKQSLARQGGADIEFLVISLYPSGDSFAPKPNIYQGDFRVTRENWWAVSSARNSALCRCKTDFICFIDDRCVLAPTWLESVRAAMAGNYVMAGGYEKRHNMKVENGAIVDFGTLVAEDVRDKTAKGKLIPCPGEWVFGCCVALPLEWALKVNGYPEKFDSVSCEDCAFGLLLQNNHFPIKYDPRAKIIEDRTPEKLGEPMKRSSKEKHPNDTGDKTHKLLAWVRDSKTSGNDYDIRELREKIQRGEPFPIPDPDKEWRDDFDGQPIKEF